MKNVLQTGREVVIETDNGKISTLIHGLRKNSYVLLETGDEHFSRLKQGASVVCRIFTDGIYYGFITIVSCLMPEIGLAAIKWPDDIVESNARISERFYVNIPVVITTTSTPAQERYRGVLRNVSDGGCEIITENDIPTNTVITVAGVLHTDLVAKKLRGIIRRKREVDGNIELGIQFSIDDEVEKATMDKFFDILRAIDIIPRGSGSANKAKMIPDGEQCQITFGRNKLSSMLRGSRENHHIITDIASEGGKPFLAQRNASSVMRFINNGVVYGFETFLIRQYTSPVQLWVWKYPFTIEKLEIRKSKRVSTFIGVSILMNGRELSGTVLDLSEDGGLIVVQDNGFCMEDVFNASMKLPTGAKVNNIQCRVQHIKPASGQNYLGVRFTSREGEDFGKLETFYFLMRKITAQA